MISLPAPGVNNAPPLLRFRFGPEEATDHLNAIVVENPHDFVAFLSTMLSCALQHEGKKALQALSKEKRDIVLKEPEGPWLMAGCLALLDEKTEALSWLERAVARGWANYPLFAKSTLSWTVFVVKRALRSSWRR